MLQAESLTRYYGPFAAVDGLSFSVESGTIYGLLGPNGAGKTTTLRMLAGILDPTSGTILVDGHRFADDPFEARRRIGFLSADTQLYERLTPREILTFFGSSHEMSKAECNERIQKLVDEIAMSDYIDRRISRLSSGQKQRVNIARTLLHDPQILILDEVTASLDILSSRYVVEYLRKAREDGKTIIFSTHIMGEAEYLCDQIGMIHEGKLIEEGTTEEILSCAGEPNLTDAFLKLIGREEEAAGHGHQREQGVQ